MPRQENNEPKPTFGDYFVVIILVIFATVAGLINKIKGIGKIDENVDSDIDLSAR